eukprot:TRINITY_DN16448_c0_g1_i2.p1 TRINITY_DN16448_c0_g1~~TRINITY_DN16448_c0_g1_i2.p1  ORF type:complete len:672 (+),score=217.46 TRINITY_DN16448_c0_g1_i2:225-2240(+)
MNLLDCDSDRTSEQNAIRSLQQLRSGGTAHQLQASQLTVQARQWFQLPSDEQLLQRFGCSLIHKIVFTGHLYLTSNFLCFCSAQYGERVAVVMPLDAIEVETYDSMMLMPCAIRVCTQIGDYLLGEFSDRDLALQAITEHQQVHCGDSDTDKSFHTNEADTDTAYTCMESEMTGHTDASEHTCKSELSDDASHRSDRHKPQPPLSSTEDDNDSDSDPDHELLSSPPTSPTTIMEGDLGAPLVDECGFAVPEQHRELFLDSEPSSAARAQQRQVWAKHLKLNGSGIELIRTKSLSQLTRFWGIPVGLRSMVWASCCGALCWSHTHPGYFDQLTLQTPPASVLEQIAKDLPRSLHGHEKYSGEDAPGLLQLQRVLKAYACHNPALGYCQAMNFLCAFLLVFMEEEQAFWTLCCVVEHLLPDYFTYDMLGSIVDCAVFEELVKDMCPDIAAFLGANQFYPGPKWFIGLFLNVLPYTTVARVWDCFLCEGPTALFRVGLALLKLNSHAMSTTNDPTEFLQIVEKSAECCYDATEILRVAFDDELAISSSRIRDLRARHRVKALQHRQAPVMKELVRQSHLQQEVLVNLVSGFASRAEEFYPGDGTAPAVLSIDEHQWRELLRECLPSLPENAELGAAFDALCVGEHRRLSLHAFVQSVRSGETMRALLVDEDRCG